MEIQWLSDNRGPYVSTDTEHSQPSRPTHAADRGPIRGRGRRGTRRAGGAAFTRHGPSAIPIASLQLTSFSLLNSVSLCRPNMSGLDLIVFGASGASGQEFVLSALERGHAVRTFLRPSTTWSAPSQVQSFRGTFNDPSLLQDAVAGVDAVCSFIGPRPPNTDVFCAAATQAILNAMAVHGVQRFACVTGAMVAASTASVSVPARLVAALFRLARAQVAEDRVSQEAIVRSSATSWTLFKPPRLRAGPRSVRVAAGPEVRVGLLSFISRTDLANLILDAVEKGQFIRQAVFVRAAA